DYSFQPRQLPIPPPALAANSSGNPYPTMVLEVGDTQSLNSLHRRVLTTVMDRHLDTFRGEQLYNYIWRSKYFLTVILITFVLVRPILSHCSLFFLNETLQIRLCLLKQSPLGQHQSLTSR